MEIILQAEAAKIRLASRIIPAAVVESEAFWLNLNRELGACFEDLGLDMTLRFGKRNDIIFCVGFRKGANIKSSWLEGDFS